MEPLHTLIFSELHPLPENIGTRMRTMNFARFFRKQGEVDLAYRRQGPEARDGQGPFRKEFGIDRRIAPGAEGGASRFEEFRGRVRRLAERRPWIVPDWPREAVRELGGIVSGDAYDIVLCRYAQDSHPFLAFPEAVRNKVVIDFDDVLTTSLFDAKVPKPQGLYGRVKRRLQKEMLLSYQKRFLGFGAVLFCSEEDRNEVTGPHGSPNAYVVPNTYPATLRIRTPDDSGYGKRRTLLFVGALDYGPNVDGLKWFLESVFPEVRQAHRDLRLLVVGRRPKESLARLCHECPGVELHPDVPDVEPFYEMCGAVVVPLLSGGGTRIKILEAAMAGRPVFSTPVGAHGLSLREGTNLNLFADGKSFIERYGILEDEKRYRECAMDTFAAVRSAYSPEAFDKSMEAVIERIRKGIAGNASSRPNGR